MGSTRPFDAFTFFFRETAHGIFIAHCYQYEPGRSTWVMETDPQTFARAGLDPHDETASARFLERVFAAELDGHRLIVNRSIWRNFPTVRCARWTAGNVVLIGDAKATAHFSIGSGTKLAMEDAIALYQAFRAVGGRNVPAALAHFEAQFRFETDCWDVHSALQSGEPGFVLLDVRSPECRRVLRLISLADAPLTDDELAATAAAYDRDAIDVAPRSAGSTPRRS